ncbi:Homeobox-like domain superfamily [Arabidopsis thaliana x Arabidopsis arenosa]|uniref:Homeobox-like domain superfamily n=1 Tax=Arabidopsis thaliana x Arabidopsis arenosa TaxID=1240361 RepID=A0A8T1YCP2_9BRAS|nr:Homeobox-like domain superfamily [Arabidopsis thaliana x Arabidopsis arenosa]
MTNPPWTNEEMNHHNSYSSNLTTPSESSWLKSRSGIAMDWTSEEDESLVRLLDSYSSESSSVVTRYSKIAACFENKTIRDVGVRSRWIHKKKENAKRRKDDHNGLGRARVDNKEIIDMVVASQVFQPSEVFQPSQHVAGTRSRVAGVSAEVPLPPGDKHPETWTFSAKSGRTSIAFSKILNENVWETWKQMPPLPEKLNDELFCDIYKAIERSSH